MPSPLPGMDPYLEGYLWPDVHPSLAGQLKRQLGPLLGPRYVARLSVSSVNDLVPVEELGILYPAALTFAPSVTAPPLRGSTHACARPASDREGARRRNLLLTDRSKRIILGAIRRGAAMTVITLPADVDARITEQARLRGTTPEKLAIEGLRTLFPPRLELDASAQGDRCLFDLLSGYVGTIAGSNEAWSEDTDARFLAGLEDKQRLGHV